MLSYVLVSFVGFIHFVCWTKQYIVHVWSIPLYSNIQVRKVSKFNVLVLVLSTLKLEMNCTASNDSFSISWRRVVEIGRFDTPIHIAVGVGGIAAGVVQLAACGLEIKRPRSEYTRTQTAPVETAKRHQHLQASTCNRSTPENADTSQTRTPHV